MGFRSQPVADCDRTLAPWETERLLPYKGVIWEAGLAPDHVPPGGLLEPTGPLIRQDYGYPKAPRTPNFSCLSVSLPLGGVLPH
jgi:hypothetical protein